MNNDSRTKNSARNLTMSFIQKVVHILLTFFGRQIFLQILSVEYLGINGLFSNILMMLSLADMGLVTAMSFSFYKPLAEKDEDKLAALIRFYRMIYNVIAAFVGVAGLALTPFLRHVINLENDIPYIEVYYLIAVANTVISYLFVYKATIITADQKHSTVSRITVLTSILRTVLQIVLLYFTRSFMAYCLMSIVGTLINNVVITRKASSMYPFIKRKVKLDPADRKSIFSNIRSMFIYKAAHVLYNGTDNIFISAIIGTAVVGKYENYSLAVTNLSAIALMVFSSLTPSIGNLIAKESPQKRMSVFRTMQTASYWIAGFFVFCLFFLLDDFVVLWLGRAFIFDMTTKIAILLSFYLSLLLYPVVAFREATGIYQKTKYVVVVGAMLKILFSITLGMYWGLAGIALSATISRLLTYAWYEPKVLFRDFLGSRATGYFAGHLINFVMLTACIATAHFLFPWKESAGWLAWGLKGVVYTICINAVYFLRYFRTQEFNEIVKLTKRLLKRS